MASMGEIFAFLMCSLAAIVALSVWIPWLGQKSTLYGLHELRDQLYQLADERPWLRETLLYRDVEHFFAAAIHVVRDRPFHASLLLFPSTDAPTLPPWRIERAKLERTMFYQRSATRALPRQLFQFVASARKFLWVRAATGHPVLLLLCILGLLVTAALYPVRVPMRWLRAPSVEADDTSQLLPSSTPREPTTTWEAFTAFARQAFTAFAHGYTRRAA